MEKKKYSIVVPVYNSSSSLKELHRRIAESLKQYAYELVLVDDGSTDGSWGVIRRLSDEYPEVVAVQLGRNYGQHAALFCGLTFCTGDFVVTMDDDLQHPPEQIVRLIDKQAETNADVVYGIYRVKQHSWFRNRGSFFIKKSAMVAEGNQGYGSSFRLMHKSIVSSITVNQSSSFYFLDELLHWYTNQFERVEVEHHPRKHGASGYSFGKLLHMYFDVVFNYSSYPLRLMTMLGLLFSVLSFLGGMFFVLRKVIYNAPLGFTYVIVAILFTASVTMFCLGIIGQYLFKIQQQQHSKPLYSVREILKRNDH